MKKRMLIMLSALCALTGIVSAADDLASRFAAPPDSAKPRVYWWWLNSLVDKEGITRDLKEYRAKGIGGVLLFDAGMPAGPMPAGPKFMSQEWLEMFQHALREADRLGIEVSVNLCSGWDAGGPWITSEFAAKHFVQSELRLVGPRRFSGKLSRPAGDSSCYRDVCVQAVREQSGNRPLPLPSVSASSAMHPTANAVDGNEETFWVSEGRKPGEGPTQQKPEWLRFEFIEPITAKTLHLIPRTPFGPRQIEVQVSQDGQEFATVKAFSLTKEASFELPLPPTTARIFRILITDSYATQNTQVREVWWDNRKTDGRALLVALKSGRDSSPRWSPNGSIRELVEAPLPKLDVAPGDAPINPDSIVDLTAKVRADGQLDWDVPEGRWTILRTGCTITGAKVRCSNPGGEGFEMDWLSTAATDLHFKSMADVLCRKAGPLAGKSLKYVHDDSWEVGLPNWTDGFLAQFKKFRGYDARPYLPVFAGRIVTSAEVSDRFLHDFRKTVADCLADNHYGRLAKLARAKGLRIHCEAGGPCYPKAPPMDALKNLGRCDVPMGEFWQSSHWKESGQNHATKEIACAAHIYGRIYVAAEAFTKIGPHYEESFADLKPTADIALCEGINRFFLHTSTCSRSDDGKPGYEYFAGTHFNRNVTWWEQSDAFLAYVARCQHLLQQGLFVGDVLYYNGDGAPNFVEVKHTDPSLGPGYDYDVCNAEVLLTRASVKNGRIVLPDGMSYRLLVLPERRTMPVEVLRKIAALVKAGATVVGPKPLNDPGLKNYPRCDDEIAKLAAEGWGDCNGQTVMEHRFGKGRIVWGKTLRTILLADGVQPDFEFQGSDRDTFLDFIHRTAAGTEIYFVANRKDRREVADCTFRVCGKQPELWDPITGRTQPAVAFKQSAGRTTLPLEFAPHGSLFVVFRKPIATDASGPTAHNFPAYRDAQELGGPWTVQFDPKWGGPEQTVTFEKLDDWTARPEARIKHYSGKVTYRTTFESKIQNPKSKIYLDLGKVKNVAQVRLNGRDLGVVWTAPWHVEITDAVKPAGNVLEIDVVNLWPNRLIGDAGLPESQRIARTNVVIPPNQALLPSGLLGPVTVRVTEPVRVK
ncbi:MAG: glycosyl hydrolase [Verrucomicrobiia bacterium]